MKVHVKLQVSQINGHHTFDLEDLGLSKEEWEQMSHLKKWHTIQEAVFDLPEQPYWMLDSFNEN